MLKSFLLFISILLSSAFSHAQSYFDRIEVFSPEVAFDTTYNETVLQLSVSERKELSCDLTDTAGIASFRIRLGTQPNGNDLLNQHYMTDQETISPSVWFNRLGSRCIFGIGIFHDLDQAYIKLEALDSSGNVLGTYEGTVY